MIDDDDEITFTLTFNDDKTYISLAVESLSPICEEEFLACLADFISTSQDLDFGDNRDAILN